MANQYIVWRPRMHKLTNSRAPQNFDIACGIPPGRKEAVLENPLSRLGCRLAQGVLLNPSKVVDRFERRRQIGGRGFWLWRFVKVCVLVHMHIVPGRGNEAPVDLNVLGVNGSAASACGWLVAI
jgi:hypothetical protein